MHCECHLSVPIDRSKIKLSLFEIGSLLYINVCRVFSWLELAESKYVSCGAVYIRICHIFIGMFRGGLYSGNAVKLCSASRRNYSH